MFDTPLLRWLKPDSGRGRRHRSARRPTFVPRLLVLEDRTLPSTITVMNNADSGDGSLRAAIVAAQSGDHIVFDDSLQGQTITLTSGQLALTRNLDIEGPGADQLAVSGNHASRVFNISGGVTVTIAGLTITDGLAVGGPGTGGGIQNTGSNLTVANDILSNNEALGVGGNGVGGAIDSRSGAILIVTHCLFLHNQAIGSNAAQAGGINTSGSTATLTDSTFIGNLAHGGDEGNNGFTRGGGIYNITGTLIVENCSFIGNQAIAGSGGSGIAGSSLLDHAIGGGIANTDQGILFVSGSLFSDNQALGGSNARGTAGGSLLVGTAEGGGLFNAGVATVTSSTFEHNEARGGSGNTGSGGFTEVGSAYGGGIYTTTGGTSGGAGILTASNLTLRDNRAVGGAGNTAGTLVGEGIGGGLIANGANPVASSGSSTATVSNCTITDNQALGGQGADGDDGRDARGGGLANIFGAILTVSGSTVTGNQALGGAGGAGGNGGNGFGGGVYNFGKFVFDAATVIRHNHASDSNDDCFGC
jgi:hypothetical protein